jgi:hypothetical protein
MGNLNELIYDMTHFIPEFKKSEGEVIASRGAAMLIKTLDGKYALVGGSKEDLVGAREWISLFLPSVVIREG